MEKSLLTPTSVGVLSEPAGMAKDRYLCPRRLCAIWSRASCARVSKQAICIYIYIFGYIFSPYLSLRPRHRSGQLPCPKVGRPLAAELGTIHVGTHCGPDSLRDSPHEGQQGVPSVALVVRASHTHACQRRTPWQRGTRSASEAGYAPKMAFTGSPKSGPCWASEPCGRNYTQTVLAGDEPPLPGRQG